MSQIFAIASRYTQFLSSIIEKDKAFRVSCSAKKLGTDVIIELKKHYVQADQGSNINVISKGLVERIGLEKQSLADVGFQDLSMRIADYRDTSLFWWV